MHLLVTGGAGFIGRHFVRRVLEAHPDTSVTVLDKLTYAGRLENLAEFERDGRFSSRYRFVRGDIAKPEDVERAMTVGGDAVEAIVSFAAETHVDRSLSGAGDFILTDVYGVYVLLEAAKRHEVSRFLLVSTDEVYGSVESGSSTEADSLDPRSPYSASKAGGELLAKAYYTSYGLPVLITRGSNTFGPYQYPEKFLPLFITNAIDDQPLPLYGDGLNVRDWLYVEDHCAGIAIAWVKKTKEIEAASWNVSVQDLKSRLLKERGVRVSDALEVISRRQNPEKGSGKGPLQIEPYHS